MPCYYPLQGYRARRVNSETGKRSIVFTKDQGFTDMPVTVPCGGCIGCRLAQSMQWTIRCFHESQLHAENTFLTLTYNDEHIPTGHSLVKKDFQDFMKRFRKYLSTRLNPVPRIKYYYCGEYGEQTSRPHYHAIIFGFDFPDKTHFSTVRGNKYYVSETLSNLWGKGHCMIGAVTDQSIAYVARYVMKKIKGKDEVKKQHYEIVDPDTGEIFDRLPEYNDMSRGGKRTKDGYQSKGIAEGWYEKYKDDVFPSDDVVINGRQLRPPKYYDRLLELQDPELHFKIKTQRVKRAKENNQDNTTQRLAAREKVKKSQLNQLKRTL